MTVDEMNALVDKYFNVEGYTFPGHFEHRFEPVSSAMMYSMLREYKPINCLAIGTWEGGSTCVIMAALLKNEKSFWYIASEIEDDKRHATFRHCFEKNECAPFMVGDITKSLDKIPNEIDFLFHDTNHDRETTKWIHKNIFPKLKKGALVIMHDWAVYEDEKGEVHGKNDDGGFAWDETAYWIEEYKKGTLGLKKLFWTYRVTGDQETAFWIKT